MTRQPGLAVFLPKNPGVFSNLLPFFITKLESGNNSESYDVERIAQNYDCLEYKCINPTQHRKIYTTLN